MSINALLEALDERTIARDVALHHDEARLAYSIDSNTIGSFDDFVDVIADYYAYHFARCLASGGRPSSSQAASRAKEIIEREGRRRGGDIVSAYNDAHDGTNGGLRAALDAIAEALKAEAIEHHVRDVFDRHVAPNSWDDQVEIIRQFIDQHAGFLRPSIDTARPERYARNYRDLIRSYVDALRQTSGVFRRL